MDSGKYKKFRIVNHFAILYSRSYPDDRNNDHRDITFPHADNPGDGDDDENDVTSDTVDDDDSEVTQKKLTHTKKGKLLANLNSLN